MNNRAYEAATLARKIVCVVVALSVTVILPASISGSHRVELAQMCFFPELGWRDAVSMVDSDWAVDRLLQSRPSNTYNCHYYTKSFIEQRDIKSDSFRSARRRGVEELSITYLRKRGYEELRGMPRVGDIIVAERPAPGWADIRICTHSAIVGGVDDDGHISRIRQKFDARHPVVDLSLAEFLRIYVGSVPRTYTIWRKSPHTQLAAAMDQ